MDTSDTSIVTLVRMLLRGIKTDATIEPITAAHHFAEAVQTLDLTYITSQGKGYVLDDKLDGVMYVEFEVDGVVFDDHHEHPKTLKVIQCALGTLTHLEQMALQQIDNDSESDDWV